VLRAGLLGGQRIVVAGGDPPPLLAALGAEIVVLAAELADEAGVTAAAERLGPPVAVLVVDGAARFGPGGVEGVRAALDETWIAVRAVADAAWMAPGIPGGKVVLLAPRAGAAPHAEAARAGLENMARTLSIEWARFGIRTVSLAPGSETTDAEVATLVCYLASPAGDYVSGTALDSA
jgi:NAD(P)-dependent dehydrogenase (short-subunit alcohol dehydrogenase family)